MIKLLTGIFQGIEIENYLSDILSISGTLLGLSFAAITYVLQNSYKSFKFSKDLFSAMYVKLGNRILLSLAYVFIISFVYKNFKITVAYLLVASVIFQLIYIKIHLDYYSYLGYISALFSEKYVPGHYGKIRTYCRQIRNNNILNKLQMLLELFFVAFIPSFLIFVKLYSEYLVYLTASILILSVFKISTFIAQFYKFQNLEMKSKLPSQQEDNEKQKDINYKAEKTALLEYLKSREIILNENKPFLNGKLFKNLLDNDKDEAWMNITIENIKSNTLEIRKEIEKHAQKLFKLCMQSKNDINSFVLSYHIYVDKIPRNIFYRTNRLEFENLLLLHQDKAIFKIKNKLYDELFMHMQE